MQLLINSDDGKRKCVCIIGSYINAYSIYRSIREMGYSYPVMMFDTTIPNGTCLADITCFDAHVIKQKLSKKEEILALIEDSVENGTPKYIMFTDETYMDTVQEALDTERLKNTIAYTGSATGNEKIFDRLLFYQFIDQLDARGTLTPLTVEGTQNPFSLFESTFVVRLRRSWHSGVILPSITIVRDRPQYEEAIRQFREAGLTPNDWCFQELLSVSDQHNLSVCGWHDEFFHQYLVTRKVLQHPPRTGNGDVVENIADYPQELTEATRRILDAMRYRGPFEMEFVFDTHSNCYKVIELNPRFWMQHGLFEELTGNLLVRKALNEDGEFRATLPEDFPHRYWINSNRFWYRLLKGQISVLRYLSHGTCYPRLTESLKWMLHYKQYAQQQRR